MEARSGMEGHNLNRWPEERLDQEMILRLLTDTVTEGTHPQTAGDRERAITEALDRVAKIIVGVEDSASETGLALLMKEGRGASGSGMCGKVWKKGELMYKCKTCGNDPTCVVCIDCFRNGDHTGHDYAMIKTGGGCCDCGDSQVRAEIVTKKRVPRQAYALSVSIDGDRILSSPLPPAEPRSRMSTWSSVQVSEGLATMSVSTLAKAWKPSGFCSKHRGIHSEDFDPSLQLRKELKTRLKFAVRAASEKLIYAMNDGEDCADPEGARRIVEWLKEVAQCGDAFRRVISVEWIEEPCDSGEEDESSCMLSRFVLALCSLKTVEVTLPAATNALYGLFFELNVDFVFKRGLLRQFELKYNTFLRAEYFRLCNMTSRMEDQNISSNSDHEEPGIERFSVQLFTVPALVPDMIRTGGILDVLIKSLKLVFRAVMPEKNPKDDPTALRTSAGREAGTSNSEEFLEICSQVMADMNYVLRHDDVCIHLMHRRHDLFQIFLEVVTTVQCAKPIQRRVVDVERDADALNEVKRAAVVLETFIQFITETLVSGFEADPEDIDDPNRTRAEVVRLVYRVLKEWVDREKEAEDGSPYLVSIGLVHLHIPLHRVFALFVSAMTKKGMDFASVFEPVDPNWRSSLLDIVEHPLRLQVMVSQIKAQMWNRNSHLVVRFFPLRLNYHDGWFADLELYLMQVCLAFAPPEEFEKKLISRFELSKVFDPDRKQGTKIDPCPSKLLDDCLTLMVQVLVERARSGFSNKQHIRNILLHSLLASDQSYSELLRAVPKNAVVNRESFKDDVHRTQIVEEVLREIADFSAATCSEQGQYRVKDEFWKELNPFTAYLTPHQRVAAELRYQTVLKRLKLPKEGPLARLRNQPLDPQLSQLSTVAGSLCREGGAIETLLGRLDEIMNTENHGASREFLTSLLETDRPLKRALVAIRSDSAWQPEQHALIDKIFEEVNTACLHRSNTHLDELTRVQDQGAELEKKVTEMLQRQRRERQEKVRQEVLENMRKQQAAFLNTLDSEDEDFYESTEIEADAQPRRPSVDDYLARQWSRLDVCASCHEHSSEGGVLGLIGYSQLTKNLQRAHKRQVSAQQGCVDVTPTVSFTRHSSTDREPMETCEVEEVTSRPKLTEGVEGNGSNGRATLLSTDTLVNGVDTGTRIHLSFCGHYIHSNCLEEYFRSVTETNLETIRLFELYGYAPPEEMLRERENGEFYCPLCRRIANSFVPLLPVDTTQSRGSDSPEVFADWMTLASDICTGPRRDQRTLPVYWRHDQVWLRLCRDGVEDNDPRDLQVWVMPKIYTYAPSFFYKSSLQGSPTRLINSAAVMIASYEVAMRSGIEPRLGTEMSGKLSALLLYSARSQLLAYGSDPPALSILWDKITMKRADPFGALIHFVLLWPQYLQHNDVLHMVQLCHSLCKDSVSELVYLRRASVLLSYLSGCELRLDTYQQPEADGGAELPRLRGTFAIQGDLPTLVHGADGRLARVRLQPLRLAEIPYLFQDLLEGLQDMHCPHCNRTAFHPACCLVCGEMIYAKRNCCPRSTPRQQLQTLTAEHAKVCGAGIGIYLVLDIYGDLSSVVLVKNSRRAQWRSPYLDAHGEEDIGLSRGKPLFLSKARYKVLEEVWVNMGLDHDSRILAH